MANRKNTFLIKRSNVAGKVPVAGDLQLGELALNTADNILYASGTTANSILPIGWDRIARTGDTVTGNFNFFGDIKISGSSLPNGYALSVTGDTNFVGDVYVTGDLTYNGSLLVTGGTVIQSGLTANTIYTDYIDFNTNYTGATLPAGRLQWDDGNGTLVLGLKGGISDMEIGLENMALCYNAETTTLTAGTVVYVSGSQGNRPSIKRAIATGDGYSVTTLGVVSESIASGAQGFVTTFGMVNNLNTVGYSGGTPIWLSPTDAGGYTAVKPQAPYHTVLIGYIVRVHASVGSIFVQVSNGWEIDELHDVRINDKVQGDLLTLSAYNGSDVWVNSKILNGSYTMTGLTVQGSTSSDLVRITQTGAGNALVVEDDTNPDSSPFIVNASGFVGVGTYNPLSKFVVSNNNSEGIEMGYATGLTSNYLESYNRNTGYGVDMSYYIANTGAHRFYTNSFERVRIDNSGNVGIGTNSPTNKLHIKTATDQNIGFSTGTNGGIISSFNDASSANVNLSFDASAYKYFISGVEKARIDSSGNLGIGTTTPSTKLDVSGNTRITETLSASTLISTQSSGDEGGDLKLATAQTNSTLSGGSITVDVYQNRFRIFESGGSNRGVYIDLTAAATGVGTNLLSGGGGEINTASNLGAGTGLFAQKVAADLQFKSLTSTGGTVTISNDANTVNLEVIPASNFTGGTVTGATIFTNGLTANTFSATTYQNLPFSGTVIGNGTANYLPKWTGTTGQGNSQIRDDGTNIAVGMAPDTNNKFSIITFSNNYYGLWVRNASNLSGAKAIYGISNGNVGTQTGVWGVGEGHPTTGTSIGVDGGATDGLLGIGVRGTVGTSEFGSMVTGIGGYFDGRGGGEYGYPTYSYSLQLLDGTEGINKVLVSQTSDGKANWSSVLSGLTGVYTNTISATTYQNLPTDVFVTGGTYANGSLSFNNNTGGTFNIITSSNYAAGVISGATGWSSTGAGQINLPSVKVALYNNSNNIEPIIVYDVASGTTNSGGIPSLTDNDTNYIVIEYNGGSPIYNVYNNDGVVNDSDVVLAYIVYRLGNFVHVLEFGNQGAGLANKLNDRVIMTERFGWESGLTLGLSGSTGVVTLTSGIAWNGSYRQTLTAVNSQDDIFFKNYHSGGTWTYTTTGDTLNNSYYDNGTDVVLATGGKYLVNYYYRGQETNDHLYEVYGTTQYDSVNEAEAATNPELPELISSHAFLVGRIIVLVGATTGVTQTAFATVFSPSGYVPSAGEHNDLTGLQGGTAGQYYHLTSNQYNNNAYTNVDNNFSTGQTINGDLIITGNSITTTLSATSITANTVTTFIPAFTPQEIFRGVTFRNNSTTIDTYGGVTMSTTASNLAISVSSTDFSTKQIRLRYYSTTVSGGRYTGTRGSALLWYIHGGFRYVCDFRISDTSFASACQQFYGLAGQTTDLAYGTVSLVQVSTLTNLIGVGNDGADANLQIIHNSSSGTATKIDLGAGFPANRTAGAASTTTYSVTLYNAPASNTVKYMVVNNETGAVAMGEITTNLPATTQGLNFFASRAMGGGGGVTGSGQFELSKLGVYSLL